MCESALMSHQQRGHDKNDVKGMTDKEVSVRICCFWLLAPRRRKKDHSQEPLRPPFCVYGDQSAFNA